ncbi:MAG: hypothetical protein WAK26_01730 [Terracidiphilus sp.]|jgi:hypothetical protein
MTVTRFLHLEVLAFLYALAATAFFQILTGRIQSAGLFSQSGSGGQTSPGRVQLLLATIATSATYLAQVANVTNGKMPDVNVNWLYVFGGSGSVYALEKAWAAWNQRKNK